MTELMIVRTIEAPPETVFAAFVEPEKLALWWGPDDGPVLSAEVDPRVGGRFHIRFRLASDGSELGTRGVFEVVDPPRRLTMRWAWDHETGPDSRVDVTFEPVAQGTRLTLVHSRLADDESRADHEAGWNGAFDKLAARAAVLAPGAAAGH